MKRIYTNNSKETQDFAKKLSNQFKDGGIIALTGDLGAGKTTFAQGFAQGLGIKDKIISPTFLIIRQYSIPNQKNFFYHIDLYRLEDINPDLIGVDLKSLGINEIIEDPTNIILIEWADKIEDKLPNQTKKINLRRIKEDIHEIVLTP